MNKNTSNCPSCDENSEKCNKDNFEIMNYLIKNAPYIFEENTYLDVELPKIPELIKLIGQDFFNVNNGLNMRLFASKVSLNIDPLLSYFHIDKKSF